jgi:septal ring factor EnvC (AmiA/AmiB activator)
MLLGLVSLIPGAGPVVAGIGYVLGMLWRCKPCLIAMALLAAFVWGDIRATRKERAACKAADLSMQLKAKERDLAIKEDTVKFAQQKVDELTQQTTDLKKKVSDYDKALTDSKAGACPISDDNARRLRGITR